MPLGYLFVTSHALTNVANALPGAGRRRYPPRHFVSSPSVAPTAPLGSAFLAFPNCHQFHLDLDKPISPHAYLPSDPSIQGCKSTWYSLTGNFKSPPRWFCLQNNKTLPRGSSDRTTLTSCILWKSGKVGSDRSPQFLMSNLKPSLTRRRPWLTPSAISPTLKMRSRAQLRTSRRNTVRNSSSAH